MMRKTILVVDDDRDVRHGLSTRLQAYGYDVKFAEDGAQATAAIKREKPDLVLLDLGIPAGDGFTVLDRLRDRPEFGALPVIVISARSAATCMQKAMSGGARAYFEKPVEPDELMVAIHQAIGA